MDLESRNKKKLIDKPTDFSVNEDFFNPFDIRDTKKKDPIPISDKGGYLEKKPDSFNANRIEYTKKGGGYVIKARTHFGANETVELAPIILVGSEVTAVDNLKDIVFELDKKAGIYALVLGYGSLYSHSDKPNISYAYNKKTKQMHFITNRVIKYGEDLTINYGKDYWVAKKEFNMVGDSDPSKAAVTELKPVPANEIEESEVQPRAADIESDKVAKMRSLPNSRSNPVVSGISIKGLGQQ